MRMKVLNVSLLMVLARCSPEHRAFFMGHFFILGLYRVLRRQGIQGVVTSGNLALDRI